MPRYYLYMKQKGEGCDYMIGCGQKLVRLNTSGPGDLMDDEIYRIFREHGFDDRHVVLAEAMVLECTHDAMHMLEGFYQELHQEREAADLAKKRAQFERLKRELGEE